MDILGTDKLLTDLWCAAFKSRGKRALLFQRAAYCIELLICKGGRAKTTAPFPQEPDTLPHYEESEKVHDEWIDYTENLINLVVQKEEEKEEIEKSILDLSHPNIKMLLQEREAILREAKWMGQSAISEAMLLAAYLGERPLHPTETETARAIAVSEVEKRIVSYRSKLPRRLITTKG